jgi:hypothetical protein
MAVEVTLMIASVGSWICGSATSVTRTSSFPCHVRAHEAAPSGFAAATRSSPLPLTGRIALNCQRFTAGAGKSGHHRLGYRSGGPAAGFRVRAPGKPDRMSRSQTARFRFWPRRDDISGEVAVVTGASRGLGLLLARELARHSCPLVICARDAAELERAAQDLRAIGTEVTTVACDLVVCQP